MFKRIIKSTAIFAAVLIAAVSLLNAINSSEITDDDDITETTVPKASYSQTELAVTETEDTQIKEIVEKAASDYGLTESNFSFFYYNIDESKYYYYNEEKYFTAASTIKVPIAMLYYDMINSGEMDLNDTLTYTSDCYEAGAGQTASLYSVSSEVPLDFLLEQAIVNSDNTAINILIKNLGYTNCSEQISQYGDDIDFPDEFFSSNITSAEYGYELMTYLYENSDDYSELISNMKQSSYGLYLKKYLDDEVAHKYGSYNGYVHDYGIVYADTTYLIGIYTSGIENADEFIAKLSLEINNAVNS